MPRMTFDKEKVSMNIARLKKGGSCFEIVVNPDLAIEYRKKRSVNVKEALRDQKIFSDAKRGMISPEDEMEKAFSTKEPLKIAEEILKHGEVHLTAEYKAKIAEEKRKKIIGLIHSNGVDPRTDLPHPVSRIENAFQEAKVKIKEHKSAEDQIQDIIKALRPILPIRFEVKKMEIKLPSKYAGRLDSLAKGFAKILKRDWKDDGSLNATVEIPGGLEQDFYERINNFTNGSAETEVLDKR